MRISDWSSDVCSSDLSACAGLVFVPKRELVVRQFAFVALSPEQAMAVIVSEDGSVENRVIDLPPGISAAVLTQAGNYMSAMLSGLTLAEARARLGRPIEIGRASCRERVCQNV